MTPMIPHCSRRSKVVGGGDFPRAPCPRNRKRLALTWSPLRDSGVIHQPHEFDDVVNLHLFEDAGAVFGDGFFADAKLAGYLFRVLSGQKRSNTSRCRDESFSMRAVSSALRTYWCRR